MRLGAAAGQRHHGQRGVRDDQLGRYPVDDPALLVPAQRRRQFQDPARQREHLALDHHPERHPAGGGPLLRLVLQPADRDGVPGDQGAHLVRRPQLQLVEAVRHRARARDHLDQIVHGGLGGIRPVLLGEQRRRQLRLLQLMALLGEQCTQGDPGRRRHPSAGAGGRLGGEALLLQPAQRPLGLRLGKPQPVREVVDLRRSHRDERTVGGLLSLVETYGSQHPRTPPRTCHFRIVAHSSAGRSWRKAATA